MTRAALLRARPCLMPTESLRISAPAERIWPLVADLRQMVTWNEKLALADPRSDGEPRVGYTCRTTWRMSGRQRAFLTRIEVCEPPRRVVFAHHDEAERRRVVREHFELEPAGSATRVVHRLDLSGSGLPLPARWLIALIDRFGTPQGPTVLETLRDAVETQPADHQTEAAAPPP